MRSGEKREATSKDEILSVVPPMIMQHQVTFSMTNHKAEEL